MLHNGLYEQVINKALEAELATTDKLSQTSPIDEAEAAKIFCVRYRPRDRIIHNSAAYERRRLLSGFIQSQKISEEKQ